MDFSSDGIVLGCNCPYCNLARHVLLTSRFLAARARGDE